MIALAVAGFVVLVMVLAGVTYQSVGLARDARRFSPPGELVDVGGHRLHAMFRGRGAPTVALESAIAASSLSWSRVLPEVARFTSVCAYDRAGLGWSDAPRAPRSLTRVVEELRTVMTKQTHASPAVMVGHSFGVFVCLAYAARYPQFVSGLVLVDPPSEWVHRDSRQVFLLHGAMQLSRLGGILAHLGVVRACLALLTAGVPAAPRYFVKVFGRTTARTLERLVGEVRKLPPETHPVVQAVWSQPKCFRAMAEYLRVFDEVTAAADQFPPPRHLPLVVISSGDQPADILAAHKSLARMSSHGRHIVASKSGHWVPFDEPELVVEAIRMVVDDARRARMFEST